jgi:hypothetical protein
MPQKLWVVGEEVLSDDFNDYVQNQVLASFPNAAARTTQWAAPPEGAVSYLADTDSLWFYSGAAWIPFSGTFGCRLRRNSAFSVPNAAQTAVPMDTVVTDNGGYFNVAGGGAVVPAGLGGLHHVSFNVQFPNAFWITPNAYISLIGVGSLATQGLDWMRSGTQWQALVNVGVAVRLAAGADIRAAVVHFSGGAANLGFAATAAGNVPVHPTLDVWRIGP